MIWFPRFGLGVWQWFAAIHLVLSKHTAFPVLPNSHDGTQAITSSGLPIIPWGVALRLRTQAQAIYRARHDLNNIHASESTNHPHRVLIQNVSGIIDLATYISNPTKNSTPRERNAIVHLIQHITELYTAWLHERPIDPLLAGMWELRSLTRELLGFPPILEQINADALLEQFLATHMFANKHSPHLPVVPTLQKEEGLPPVWLDAGDFFRSTRNLLKDVAGHGYEKDGVIPIFINLQTQDNMVMLSMRNHGELSPVALQCIGRVPYSESGEVEHGYGKKSVSSIHHGIFSAFGMAEDVISHIIDNQWANETHDGQPYVRWQMPLIVAR